MKPESHYWFRAKSYGWGWGLPCSWQGWVAYGLHFVLLFCSVLVAPPTRSPIAFIVYTLFISLLLVALCWLKGEPTRWRWGKGDA